MHSQKMKPRFGRNAGIDPVAQAEKTTLYNKQYWADNKEKLSAAQKVRSQTQEFKDRENARHRARYANDETFREKEKARSRTNYRTEAGQARSKAYNARPEVKKRKNERRRTPEYREKNNAKNRERYKNDPKYRASCAVHNRAYRLKKKTKIL